MPGKGSVDLKVGKPGEGLERERSFQIKRSREGGFSPGRRQDSVVGSWGQPVCL